MLNMRQETFVQNIIKGMSQREAYKDAYKVSYKNEAIDSKASTLFNSEKVQERYKSLLSELEDNAIMTAKERMKWLSRVINNEEKEESKYFDDGECVVYEKTADLNTKMKAMDILNKMDGQYVTKMEGNLDVTIEVDINEN